MSENAIEQRVQGSELRWVEGLRNVDGAIVDEPLQASILSRFNVLLYVAHADGLEVVCHDATLLMIAC